MFSCCVGSGRALSPSQSENTAFRLAVNSFSYDCDCKRSVPRVVVLGHGLLQKNAFLCQGLAVRWLGNKCGRLLGLRVMIKATAITRAMLLIRGSETARPVSQRHSCQQQAAPQKYLIFHTPFLLVFFWKSSCWEPYSTCRGQPLLEAQCIPPCSAHRSFSGSVLLLSSQYLPHKQ